MFPGSPGDGAVGPPELVHRVGWLGENGIRKAKRTRIRYIPLSNCTLKRTDFQNRSRSIVRPPFQSLALTRAQLDRKAYGFAAGTTQSTRRGGRLNEKSIGQATDLDAACSPFSQVGRTWVTYICYGKRSLAP